MEWNDTTSYTRGERGTVEPKTWTLLLSGSRAAYNLEIIMTRHRSYEPDVWLMSCRTVGIEHVKLKNKDLRLAQSEAITLVKKKLEGCLQTLARLNS